MELSVPEIAERLRISPQRVHVMLQSGQLEGRKVGGRWVLDEAQLLKPRRLSRPFSARVAWAAILGPGNVDWLSQPDRSKLRARLGQLRKQPDAAQRLASWLAARAPVVDVAAPRPAALWDDPDLVPSGISDPRSGMSGGDALEFYAQPGTLEHVMNRHLLVDDPSGLIRLREAPVHLESPVSLLLLAADLVDRGGPRELRRADELIAEALK